MISFPVSPMTTCHVEIPVSQPLTLPLLDLRPRRAVAFPCGSACQSDVTRAAWLTLWLWLLLLPPHPQPPTARVRAANFFLLFSVTFLFLFGFKAALSLLSWSLMPFLSSKYRLSFVTLTSHSHSGNEEVSNLPFYPDFLSAWIGYCKNA
jgi:hypothetical protein